ncbi:transcription factor Sp1 [Sarotherodon galilaeus]
MGQNAKGLSWQSASVVELRPQQHRLVILPETSLNSSRHAAASSHRHKANCRALCSSDQPAATANSSNCAINTSHGVLPLNLGVFMFAAACWAPPCLFTSRDSAPSEDDSLLPESLPRCEKVPSLAKPGENPASADSRSAVSLTPWAGERGRISLSSISLLTLSGNILVSRDGQRRQQQGVGRFGWSCFTSDTSVTFSRTRRLGLSLSVYSATGKRAVNSGELTPPQQHRTPLPFLPALTPFFLQHNQTCILKKQQCAEINNLIVTQHLTIVTVCMYMYDALQRWA